MSDFDEVDLIISLMLEGETVSLSDTGLATEGPLYVRLTQAHAWRGQDVADQKMVCDLELDEDGYILDRHVYAVRERNLQKRLAREEDRIREEQVQAEQRRHMSL